MKLSDFYSVQKNSVVSVNSKTGQVILDYFDVHAIPQSALGKSIPTLQSNKLPQKYLNFASTQKYGMVKIGTGFQFQNNGAINSIGIITNQQKQQIQNKISIIKKDGNGDKVLLDDGQYQQIVNGFTTKFQFNYDNVNANNTVSFSGVHPIVLVLSQNNNLYEINDGDITYEISQDNSKTILNMNRFLMQQNITAITDKWIAYISGSYSYLDTNDTIVSKYQKLILQKSLIYG